MTIIKDHADLFVLAANDASSARLMYGTPEQARMRRLEMQGLIGKPCSYWCAADAYLMLRQGGDMTQGERTMLVNTLTVMGEVAKNPYLMLYRGPSPFLLDEDEVREAGRRTGGGIVIARLRSRLRESNDDLVLTKRDAEALIEGWGSCIMALTRLDELQRLMHTLKAPEPDVDPSLQGRA